jgi:hypothetical protein
MVMVPLELVVRLEELLLLIQSLHVLRGVHVLLRGLNHIFFELRRKLAMILFYINVVVRKIVVVVQTPLVEDIELFLLLGLTVDNLLFGDLSWQDLWGHPGIFLLGGLDDVFSILSSWFQCG